LIILGIDPGITRIGFGVVESNGNNLSCLAYGILKNTGKGPGIYKDAADKVSKIINKYKPDAVAVEKLFFFKNQKTAIPVAQMRGVMLWAIENSGLPFYEFTPLEIKSAITNYGRAEKKQVQNMVRLILKITTDIKPDDAADALAIAVCCASSVRG